MTRFSPRILAFIALLGAVTAQHAVADDAVAFDAGTENQMGLTFSPDGTTAFWTAWDGRWGGDRSRDVIYSAHLRDGAWSTPLPADFTKDYSDSDPFISPDGRWLYFVSDRPMGRDDTSSDSNIWRYSLTESNRLEFLAINSAAEEYSPVVTASGTLYFASSREGGVGQGDLYSATPGASGFSAPQLLGPAFNAPTGEWNVWVSADEQDILFEASSRPTNVSTPGDLYYSWRTSKGWTPAISVMSLNSTSSELMPRLHPDGETLYYTSAPIGGHAVTKRTHWPSLRKTLRASFAPTLLVANRSSHEVTFVDLSRGEVVARVSTGEGPHLLSNVSDGRVLATGYGEFPRPHKEPVKNRPPFESSWNSRLTLIDTSERELILDEVVDDCHKPHASWIVDNRAYVSCEDEERVAVVELSTGNTVDHFETEQRGSHVLSFEPESRTLAISNVESASLTLIDLDTRHTRVVELLAGSEGAFAVAGRFWVANASDGSVSIVDAQSGTVVEHVRSLCKFPIALSQGALQQIWVACFASAELVSIDSQSFEIQRRISLTDQPLNLLIHPTRQIGYVSLPRRNAVAEIDLVTGDELRRIDVGIEPDGLRWAGN